MNPELQHEIERLKRIFESHGTPLQRRTGISEERLAWLERELGYTFDQDLRDFYRFSEGAAYGNSWFVMGNEYPISLDFLTIDEAAKYWFSLPCDDKHDQRLYKQLEENFHDVEDEERDPRVKPRRWMHRRWWPLARSNSDTLMFDADPGPGGKCGQIIAFYHDPDEIRLIAGSFIDFLRVSNTLLETRWKEIHDDGEDEDEEEQQDE
jgi:cell wall assembly regulator SMI1